MTRKQKEQALKNLDKGAIRRILDQVSDQESVVSIKGIGTVPVAALRKELKSR